MGRKRQRYAPQRAADPETVFVERWFSDKAIKDFVESYNIPVEDEPDEGDWLRSGVDPLDKYQEPHGREDIVKQIRRLARLQPNIKSSLRYYQSYTFGRDFTMGVKPIDPSERPDENTKKEMKRAARAWHEFVQGNRKHWNVKEMGRRCWRDGEKFTRKFSTNEWPPQVRFLDPEEIKDTADGNSQGVITKPGDAVIPVRYKHADLVSNTQLPDIPAEDIFHSKIDCDSNELRGNSRYLPVVRWVRKFWGLLDIELKHRMLQASMVFQRKIKGGANQVRRHLDHATSPANNSLATGDKRREKIFGGAIMNTSDGVDYEFLQPQSNFSDASPLAKLLMLQISTATGFPYYLISGDAGDANLSGNIVQESPIALMIDDERGFFDGELGDLFEWVMEEAAMSGKVSKNLFDDFVTDIRWPSIVTRDLVKEAQANNLKRMGGCISRQEWCRREGVDPDQMEEEIVADMENQVMGPQGDVAAMNQTNDQKKSNQAANQGTGTNQGDGKPIQHSDNQTGVSQ